MRGATVSAGVYAKDPAQARARHYCSTSAERARSLEDASRPLSAADVIVLAPTRDVLRSRSASTSRSQRPVRAARPASVSQREIDERRRRCRRTVDAYRQSGGPRQTKRPQSASCVQSWEDRMHEFVRRESVWLRSHTGLERNRRSRKQPKDSRKSASGEEPAASKDGESEDGENEPAWVHDYFRMCSASMNIRQHFIASEELLALQETVLGPSLESCKKALMHLGVFMQENTLNLRARLMRGRALGLIARYKLGETNAKILLAVAEKLGARSENDHNRFMGAMAAEGFNAETLLEAGHAEEWLRNALVSTGSSNPGAAKENSKRAPGAERRKPLEPTGALKKYGAAKAQSGFGSMALGRNILFPDGTTRAVFSQEAYDEAMAIIAKAPKRKTGLGRQ